MYGKKTSKRASDGFHCANAHKASLLLRVHEEEEEEGHVQDDDIWSTAPLLFLSGSCQEPMANEMIAAVKWVWVDSLDRSLARGSEGFLQ